MRTKNRHIIFSTPIAVLMLATFTTATPAAAQDAPSDAAVPIIPHDDLGRGDIRSETLAAAIRLKGMTNAFEPDGFIAHILYVTGIVEKGLFPARGWAPALTRRLKKAGLIRTKAVPARGDLVFFSLSPSAPHSAKASKVSVGVVERVRKGSIDFVAAGSGRVIRGTLKTGKGKVSETKLTSCTVKTGKAGKAVVEKSGGKSKKGKQNDKSNAKSKKSATKSKKASSKSQAQPVRTKQVPCRASELLIGFASIEDVAIELNVTPPSPPAAPPDDQAADPAAADPGDTPDAAAVDASEVVQ